MLKHFPTVYSSDSAYLTQLFFSSPASLWQIIVETIKAPHYCDWTVTVVWQREDGAKAMQSTATTGLHAIAPKYLE